MRGKTLSHSSHHRGAQLSDEDVETWWRFQSCGPAGSCSCEERTHLNRLACFVAEYWDDYPQVVIRVVGKEPAQAVGKFFAGCDVPDGLVDTVTKKLETDTEQFIRNSDYRTIQLLSADNPFLPVDVLERYVTSGTGDVLVQLAGNPSAPAHIFDRIVERLPKRTRMRKPAGCKTSPHIPTVLTEDECYKIVSRFALNPSTPAHILEDMCSDVYVYSHSTDPEDENFISRRQGLFWFLAQNPHLPPHLFDTVTFDKHVTENILSQYGLSARNSIPNCAVYNPNIPDSCLKKIFGTSFKSFPYYRTDVQFPLWAFDEMLSRGEHAWLAMNPHTPEHILVELSETSPPTVVAEVVWNPSTPDETLNSIAETYTIEEIFYRLATRPDIPYRALETVAKKCRENTVSNIRRGNTGSVAEHRLGLYREYGGTEEHHLLDQRFLLTLDDDDTTLSLIMWPTVSPVILEEIISDESHLVQTQTSALLNSVCPPKLMRAWLKRNLCLIDDDYEEFFATVRRELWSRENNKR